MVNDLLEESSFGTGFHNHLLGVNDGFGLVLTDVIERSHVLHTVFGKSTALVFEEVNQILVTDEVGISGQWDISVKGLDVREDIIEQLSHHNFFVEVVHGVFAHLSGVSVNQIVKSDISGVNNISGSGFFDSVGALWSDPLGDGFGLPGHVTELLWVRLGNLTKDVLELVSQSFSSG